MRPSRLALLSAIAVFVAACSSGTGSTPAPSSTASVPPSAAPSASADATWIEVQLTDALKIEPAMMTVPAGVPVTFVVTNTGAIDHEFYLGNEAAQAAHEQEMMEMGEMAHDEEMGVGVEPGETKELTVTFPEPGSILAGCHVAGHYAGGMKATVAIGSWVPTPSTRLRGRCRASPAAAPARPAGSASRTACGVPRTPWRCPR